MKHKALFKACTIPLTPKSWREALEDFRVMRALMIKVILSLFDGLTKEHCIAAHLFWTECRKIRQGSGALHLALYLKQCRVCLQKFAASDLKPELSVYVSLTRCGLPRIIPSFHRKKVRDGNLAIVQLYMSLFSVSKLIELAPRVSKRTFESITSPNDLIAAANFALDLGLWIPELLHRYCPKIDSMPLNQGLEFKPTWKATPSQAWYSSLLKKSAGDDGKPLAKFANYSSIFTTLPYELASFKDLVLFSKQFPGQTFLRASVLWPKLIRFPFDSNNDWFTTTDLKATKRLEDEMPSRTDLGVCPPWGKLCQAQTGDGKRRIFAIGNYINQRLLAPFHKWLSDVLRTIPMDGTFNQTRPLDLLKGVKGTVHSVDLKAATDRWPLPVLTMVAQSTFGELFAKAAVNTALAMNTFDIGFIPKRKIRYQIDLIDGVAVCHANRSVPAAVSFVAGQPLGYLSSWPLFALSHHIVMWYSAEQIYPGRVFRRYAILGDDVVIADTRVCNVYKACLAKMGVQISVAKSLTSPTGACEFAKRFRLRSMTVDASPVSIKKILASSSPLGWYNYILTLPRTLRFSTELRLAGVGFKAASRDLTSSHHKRFVKRLVVMKIHAKLSKCSFALSLSTVLGFPVQPQVIGRVIWFLLDYYFPKEPVLPPTEVFAYAPMAEFNEYTVYRSWMESYLKYLKWNISLRMKSSVSLDDFRDVPIYIRTTERPRIDNDTFRFGVTFRIYDMVLALQGKHLPRCLPISVTSGTDDSVLQ